MKSFEIIILIVWGLCFIILLFLIPNLVLKFRPQNSDKKLNRSVRNMFLLDALKVSNDDISIDDVYLRVSKYKGSFKG